MRKLLTGLTVLAALATAGTSQAAPGTVAISWDDCAPVVQDKTTAVAASYSIFMSEVGNDVPNTGYQVRAIYGNATGDVPDAWRFDGVAGACQGKTKVTLDELNPLSEVTCPTFAGTVLAALPVKSLARTPITDPYAVTTMRIVVANVYPEGWTPVGAATRYFLAAFTFNHIKSVVGAGAPPTTCGGYEQSMCFKVTVADYNDMSGNTLPFNRPVAAGAPLFVTFNGGGACGGVPALPKTWGEIKNQYRN